MTLFNFDEDDDQMVPQVHLDCLGSGRRELTLLEAVTGTDSTLNTPILNKPCPDFASLLSGLDDDDYYQSLSDAAAAADPFGASDEFPPMYPMATDTTDTFRSLGDTVHEQDVTFYDDQPVGGVTIKQEKCQYYPQEDYLATAPHQQLQHQVIGTISSPSGGHGSQQLPSDDDDMRRLVIADDLQDETQSDIDAVTKEIDTVCTLLNIPVSPYQWTEAQVTNWAAWTLEQYNLPSCYLYELKIDGTMLCMLSAEEFKMRWPQFGEYLFAQLEVWKGAYDNINADTSPTELCDEPRTYAILEPAAQHHQQHQHQHHQHYHHQQPQTSHLQLHSPLHHQQQHQLHHTQQHPQPAYIPMTQTTTSPTPSPCHSMYSSDMMFSASVISSVNAIPKPVTTTPLQCGNTLSPASSLDSMDSFSPSPVSETDFDRSYGSPPMQQQDPRPEVTPSKQNIHLWQFLRELLIQQHNYGTAIRWMDRPKGIFKIEDSARIAKLWGQRKNRPAMNYDKLSRSIRQYYKKGIIKKTDNSKRLVYQFCPQYRV